MVSEIKDAFLDTVSASCPIGASDAKLGFFEWVVRNLLRVFAPLL